jgi:probable HAF family extracellular repeat protein
MTEDMTAAVKGRHMRKTSQCLGVTCAAIALVLQTFASVAFGQATYTFSTIDVPLPNGQLGFTSLADVNDEGQIVGGFTDSLLGPYGFLLNFKKKTRSTAIRCGKDVVATEPQSINRHGEIAGIATVVVERIKIPQPPFKIIITKTSGFFRDRTGKCSILDFPGANLTEAIGINDDGQVVGDYSDANGIFHGFFWDNGQFITFDVPFPEATSTAPSGINNIGQRVGFYFDNNVTEQFPNGHARGFLFDNGSFTRFDFPGAVETFPGDLNDEGQIIGIFAADAASIGQSFVFDAGTFTIFDVPFSGVVATQVSGINNEGQIVGRYIQSNPSDPVNPFPSHGFVATPNVNSPLVGNFITTTRTGN